VEFGRGDHLWFTTIQQPNASVSAC
jgi:hypothetical protein